MGRVKPPFFFTKQWKEADARKQGRRFGRPNQEGEAGFLR